MFYIFAVFNQTVHGLSYYMSLGQVGSVTTATMNGLRAILVFVSSSILFCRYFFINIVYLELIQISV